MALKVITFVSTTAPVTNIFKRRGDFVNNTPIFKCLNSNHEMVPKELLKELKIDYCDIYKDSTAISFLSRNIKDYKKETICRIPFCNTLEAENMGALINHGDNSGGPRVSDYFIKTIDAISNVKNIDLTKGKLRDVLDSIKELKASKETVCLYVSGPITIATSLMESSLFYRAFRKDKDKLIILLKVIEDSLVDYILEAEAMGADIISYADPVGTIDIVGPKMYEALSGKITYSILKRIEGKLNNTIVHLCGKTSTSLEAIGLIKPNTIELNEPAPYDEILRNLTKEKNSTNFIGHWCINMKKSSKIVFLKRL